jgi:predicted dehydrogenase
LIKSGLNVKKNIAVIGCGHWGKNLLRNFSELEVLTCVCDPNVELAESFASQYKVDNVSFDQVVNNSDVDGVVLAVPAPLHAPLAIKALGAGKHVYVEKPLAMNLVEAQQVIDASVASGQHLMVGHLLQYHPVFVTLHKLVKAGEIGKLNYIYSNRLSLGKIRSEEDVIWSFAPHDISMILSLTGQEPELVRTEYVNILQTGIADSAMIHMKFKDGLKAHVAVSWLHPYKEQKLVVIGEDAMAVFDDTLPWNNKLTLYRHKIDVSGQTPMSQKSEGEYFDIPHAEPLKQECQYFVDLINGNAPPLTDGHEGMRVLKVLTAASSSQSKKCAVNMG